LTFTAFNGGAAVNVTFGDGTGGTVKTLTSSTRAAGQQHERHDRLHREADDRRLQRLRLLDARFDDGGWRDRRHR
jgi:hypothetical protein